jgi:hypothetical protein
VAYPKKLKAGPEEMETSVDTFEEHSDKFEAMGLKGNPEVMEAIVEWQELHKCLVVLHRR